LRLRHRPTAASEGQENCGAERSGKAKPTPKTAIPGALCHVLCAFTCRLIAALDGHRPALAPHSWASPPLIKDAAEPPGWLGAMRGLVELTKLKRKKSAERSYFSRF